MNLSLKLFHLPILKEAQPRRNISPPREKKLSVQDERQPTLKPGDGQEVVVGSPLHQRWGTSGSTKRQCIWECGASTLRSSAFSRESRNPVILRKVFQFLKRSQKSLRSCVDPIPALECSWKVTEHRLWGRSWPSLHWLMGWPWLSSSPYALIYPSIKWQWWWCLPRRIIVKMKWIEIYKGTKVPGV